MKTKITSPLVALSLLAASTVVSFAQSPSGAAPGNVPATQPSTTNPETLAPNANPSAAEAEPAVTPAATAPAINLPAAEILPTGDTSTPAGATLTGRLDAGRTASTIGTQEIEKRDDLLKELNDRLTAVDQQVSSLRERSGNLDDADQQRLNAAVTDYEKNKKRLQDSIEAARSVEAGPSWDRARASLATNYAFFVASVGGIEVAIPN